MITIILEDVNDQELERISEEKNQRYLIQNDEDNFKYLSLLDECSYSVFARDDMSSLVLELEKVRDRAENLEHINHINEIIGLAKQCQCLQGSTLTFTPFE